jgi:hypothetical protein
MLHKPTKEPLPIDRTIVGWSAKLRETGRKDLASKFDTDVVKDFHLVKALRLPTYDAYLLPCSDFMKRVGWYKKHFLHDRYYLNLLPIQQGHRKYSLIGFSDLAEAESFIRTHLSGAYSKYLLRLSEFEDNIYGGSIMSQSGIVRAELSSGLQQSVAHGTVPVTGLTLSSYDNSAQYSTDDSTERALLWKAVESIMVPKQKSAMVHLPELSVHECGRFWFFKGYFEFAYTQRDEGAALRLVFFDVKLGPEYYNIVP